MKSIGEMIRACWIASPGLIAAVVIDSDGSPLLWKVRSTWSPKILGAMLASAFQCYQALGDGLGQFYCELVTAEFDGINVAQHMMPRGSLILVAEKSSPIGVCARGSEDGETGAQ